MPDEDFQGQPAGTEGTVEPQEHTSPWAQYLEPLPESVRPLVEPTFKQWDADVTQRFQKVQSEYAPLKDFAPLVEQGFTPDVAGQAFNLMQALNNDPEAVLRELAEAIGYDLDQGTQEPNDDGETPGEFVDPRLATVEQMTEAMAEIMLAQERQQQEAQENAMLDAHLAELKEKHGEFDEEYILLLMGNGLTGEQAVAKYQDLVGKVSRPAPPVAPTLLGAGGGLPSQGVDLSNLTSSQTKDLVAQMLAQAAQEG